MIGVGWVPKFNKVFFTVNGNVESFMYDLVRPDADLKNLRPLCAGFSGLIIASNFGQAEFTNQVRDYYIFTRSHCYHHNEVAMRCIVWSR